LPDLLRSVPWTIPLPAAHVSIRIPAACCGLVGLKPSRFRLDGAGSNLLAVNVICEGVLTRTVRDTIAFYEALESRRPPRKVPPIGVRSDQASRPLRIGLFVDSPAGSMVDTEVQQTVREAARRCAGLGHAVEEIPCPFTGSIVDDFMRYMALIAWFGVKLGRLTLHFGFDGSKVDPWTTGFVEFFGNAKLAGLAATMDASRVPSRTSWRASTCSCRPRRRRPPPRSAISRRTFPSRRSSNACAPSQRSRPPLARARRIAKTRRTMSGAGRVARPWI
jgi:hypothetical protein